MRDVRDEGRKINPNFFVIPNYGPFAHFDGVAKRAPSGFNAAAWAPYSRLIMFEEMQRPGQLADDLFVDFILQYKVAFALRFRGGVLSYRAREPTGIELGIAEAAAGGGGALIQPHYDAPESRKKFRKFFKEHAELFDGCESLADAAIIFDYNQLYWDNRTHLQAALQGGKPRPRDPASEDLRKVLEARTGSALAIVSQPGLEGLRVNSWWKRRPGDKEIMVHFVNYYCPIPIKNPSSSIGESQAVYAPKPVLNVPVRVDVGSGGVTSITLFDPDSSAATSIDFQQRGSEVTFVLPEVRIYRVVRLRVS